MHASELRFDIPQKIIELLGRHCRGDAQRWECGLPSIGVLPDSDVFALERAYLAEATPWKHWQHAC